MNDGSEVPMLGTLNSERGHHAYLSLGANLGDRWAAMQAAVRAMATLPHVELDVPAGVASMYETAPVGGPTGQTPYLNTVITLRTWLSARELLAALHEIETRLGRWRRIRWEPRTMDIDLLLFGDQSLRENELSVPHPRLHERLFVLEPLAELAAEFVHPLLHRSIADLRAEVAAAASPGSVRRIMGPEWFSAPRGMSFAADPPHRLDLEVGA
ncbi:MAG: 2-amino-4-hydroxy-6-hydroxymethyldihydropteridine diphosphokinase [Planctomycetota bacterium]|mgnify:FL=1